MFSTRWPVIGVLFGAMALGGLAACGGASKDAPATPTLAQVKGCLADAGINARGGAYHRPPDDSNAPDGELVLPDATFIAFYDDEQRAQRLGSELQGRAEQLGGSTTRHGRITVLYTKAPGAGSGRPDTKVERCVGERTTDAEAPAGDTAQINVGSKSAACRRMLAQLKRRLHTNGAGDSFNAGCSALVDPVTGQDRIPTCPKKLPPNTACDIDNLDTSSAPPPPPLMSPRSFSELLGNFETAAAHRNRDVVGAGCGPARRARVGAVFQCSTQRQTSRREDRYRVVVISRRCWKATPKRRSLPVLHACDLHPELGD